MEEEKHCFMFSYMSEGWLEIFQNSAFSCLIPLGASNQIVVKLF